jgi:hypothetical protein
MAGTACTENVIGEVDASELAGRSLASRKKIVKRIFCGKVNNANRIVLSGVRGSRKLTR